MSDLEATRDHARKMAATSVHRGACFVRTTNRWAQVIWKPTEGCAGCMTPEERALWRQIADEIDDYLTPEDDGPGLFGEGE